MNTREDVIRMAREVGFDEWTSSCLSGESELDRTLAVSEYPIGETVFKLASLVAAAERERIAKIVDDKHTPWPNTATLAAAIRALK